MIAGVYERAQAHGATTAYSLTHDPSTYIAIALCIFLLLLWTQRNTIILKRKDNK